MSRSHATTARTVRRALATLGSPSRRVWLAICARLWPDAAQLATVHPLATPTTYQAPVERDGGVSA